MSQVDETRAKKAVAIINQVKIAKNSFEYNSATKKDELITMLKAASCPYPTHVVSSLVKHNLLKKEKGTYTFMTNTPIHFGILCSDLTKASKQASGYVKKCKLKNKENKSEISSELVNQNSSTDSIDDAIALLKSKGYKVLKPVTEFFEC